MTGAPEQPVAGSPRFRRPTWSPARLVGGGLLAALLVAIVLLPFVEVVTTSLGDGGSGYRTVAESPSFRAVAVDTVEIAVVSTLLALALSVWIASYMWTHPGAPRLVCLSVLAIVFFTGILVKNFSWSVLLAERGPVNDLLVGLGLRDEPLRLLFARPAVVLGMTHYLVPIMTLPIYASLLRVDRRLLLAARSLGASRLDTLRLVTLPLARAGITTGVVTGFILAIGFYVTPAMLGGRGDKMVSNLIDNAINERNDFQTASVLAVIVAIVVLALLPLALRGLRPDDTAGSGSRG